MKDYKFKDPDMKLIYEIFKKDADEKTFALKQLQKTVSEFHKAILAKEKKKKP